MISMSFDVQPLIASAGLGDRPTWLDLAIRDRSGNVFFGNRSIIEADPVIYRIELAEGSWELAGVPAGGWKSSVVQPLRIFQIAGLIIVLLLMYLVYVVGGRQQMLSAAVKERTSDLERELAERRRAEEALLLTQSTVDQATNPIFWSDHDGRILYVNNACMQGARILQRRASLDESRYSWFKLHSR